MVTSLDVSCISKYALSEVVFLNIEYCKDTYYKRMPEYYRPMFC